MTTLKQPDHEPGVLSRVAPGPRTAWARVRTWPRGWHLAVALTGLALAACLWDVSRTPWYQEQRLSRMSLAALQRERGGRLDDPRLLYYIGLRLNQQGRSAEADPYLRNAVGLDPDSPRLRDAWAQALLGSGLVKAAFGELREFAGTHPGSSPAHLFLGRFYVAQNSMVRATDELRLSLTLDSHQAEAWSLLATAQAGLNSLGPAQEAAGKAVALRPKNARYRFDLAVLQSRLGHPDSARREFAEAVALAPRNPAMHREYARWLLETKSRPDDCARAEGEARRALALDPNDTDSLPVLGRVLVAEGRVGDGVVCLRQAAAANPYSPAPALDLARAFHRLGQERESRAWEQVYRLRERHSEAKLSLVTAIQKDATDRRPQEQLARLLAEEGDVAGCVHHYAEAFRCAPDAPRAQAAAAADLAAAGHAAEALPLAQRSVTLAANSPLAHEALGNVLLALDQPRAAAAEYDKAVVLAPERYTTCRARLTQFYATVRQRQAQQMFRARERTNNAHF